MSNNDSSLSSSMKEEERDKLERVDRQQTERIYTDKVKRKTTTTDMMIGEQTCTNGFDHAKAASSAALLRPNTVSISLSSQARGKQESEEWPVKDMHLIHKSSAWHNCCINFVRSCIYYGTQTSHGGDGSTGSVRDTVNITNAVSQTGGIFGYCPGLEVENVNFSTCIT